MEIKQLQSLYAKLPQIGALAESLENNQVKSIFLDGLVSSAAPMVFGSLYNKYKSTLLFILNDADEAGYFYHDLTQVMGESNVLFFPSSYRRAIKYGQHDSANEILRTEVLRRLGNNNESLYVVTYPAAVGELVVSKNRLDERTIRLAKGQTVDVIDMEKKFISLGFDEVDYVYEPGQFALRGSILDVYSYSSEYPYRVDFFGDDIDTIRTFEVESQLSKESKDQIEIVPELKGQSLDKVSLMKFLPEMTMLVMKDFIFVRDKIDQIYQEGFSDQAITERLEGATEQEQKQIYEEMDKDSQLISGVQFTSDAIGYRRIEFLHPSNVNHQLKITFNVTAQPMFHKNFDLLASALEEYIGKGYELYILADSQKQNQRLRDIFDEMGNASHTTPIAFSPVDKTLHEGFADNDLKVCFFTDHQIFDRYHKYNLRSDKARNGKVALSLKEINELNINDYIVHVDHGIGKFGGLVRVPQGDGYQEMVRIVYQNNDVVYVSIHSLYKISKYKGKDGEPPHLSRLGTGAWENMKERTKKKLKDIARDLIKLYSRRKKEKGYAYSEDSFMQHELEASFLYEDTPDQLKATNDVKADMEKALPMDRLVCGDVGFGKTEVAIRAAFKAAADSKQVAVLVPTTVLAYQHYKTFLGRLKNFPVRVDYLSRARSAKQTKEVLADLASGKIDIIIGTHKIIGKSVKFKDLGLLIIDEEQKFGVSTKEKLRQIKVNVDTLTMSATPIPRTLQFSLMGSRDMSVIQTPPPNRYPIQTEVRTFSSEIIKDAINFEMSRNGQVFFVSNRISSLPELEMIIHETVPDARVAIGHGQMKPEELEKIILGFVNYDYDVLLSTTIVENGIDIPNANTIIINHAQHFGLSDLHQMRGRVGRGNRKAFCYLLAPPISQLNVEARRRLEAIETFSDLGSGIHLAMQDLDIRGAGNLLGSEQSGFIADLGYETYQKILNQAMTELKNEEFSDLYADDIKQEEITGDIFVDDCLLESDLELYFPEQYVPNSSERILIYRQLDSIEKDEDLKLFRANLIDRFGDVPSKGEELMRVVSLRRLGKCLGCEKIFLKGGNMSLYFVSNSNSAYYRSSAFDKILNYIAANPRHCNLRENKGKRSMVISDVKSVEQGITILEEINK